MEDPDHVLTLSRAYRETEGNRPYVQVGSCSCGLPLTGESPRGAQQARHNIVRKHTRHIQKERGTVTS